MTDGAMTSGERNALMKMIARRARLQAADVDHLAAERVAEFERQVNKQWDAEDLSVRELVATANTQLYPHVEQIKKLIAEKCDELGIDTDLRPVVDAGVRVRAAHYNNTERAQIRTKAKSEIEAARKRAKLEIERQRNEIETTILTTGVKSVEGKRLLESLPSAESLLPPVELLARDKRAWVEHARREIEGL